MAAGVGRVHQGAGQAGRLPGPERHPDQRCLPPARWLTPADLAAIAGQVTKIATARRAPSPPSTPRVTASRTALVQTSKDKQVAVATVTFNFGKNGWNKLPDAADQIHEIAKIRGVTVHLAGAGGQAADSAESFEGLDGTLLFWTVGVVILILLFTYRSPILWLLPILSAGVALDESPRA